MIFNTIVEVAVPVRLTVQVEDEQHEVVKAALSPKTLKTLVWHAGDQCAAEIEEVVARELERVAVEDPEPDVECSSCGKMFVSGTGHPSLAICGGCR